MRGRSGAFLRASSNTPSARSLLLQPLVSQLQRPLPHRFQVIDDQLVVAARFVHAEPAAHKHLHPVLGAEFEVHVVVAETGGPDLCATVLEGKI